MSGAKKPWRQEMPDFLQFLENPLGHPVRLHEEVLGYDLYFADLSNWKLRFSDRTPFISVNAADAAALPRASWPRAWPMSCGRAAWPSATRSSWCRGRAMSCGCSSSARS